MELTVLDIGPASVRAGYTCPCGCTPSVEYRQDMDLVEEGCCCGNHFAVGRRAGASVVPRAGFRAELQTFAAPWGELIEAAWLVGPSTHEAHRHGDGAVHAHGDHAAGSTEPAKAIDPVCGMTVDPDVARANGLHSTYMGTDYFFCGRGCKLDFKEDPERYLDPSHVPGM